MTRDASHDGSTADGSDRRQRWDDAVEWIVDSAASLWGGWMRFVRAQLRSPRKLMLWIVFAFAVAAFVGAWLMVGTASEPTGCEGLQAITESDCN